MTAATTRRPHGYGRYTFGCRCPVCRAAKAAYTRLRRQAANTAAVPGVEVPGVKHGSRFAYEERGCRCEPCIGAQVQRGRLRPDGSR